MVVVSSTLGVGHPGGHHRWRWWGGGVGDGLSIPGVGCPGGHCQQRWWVVVWVAGCQCQGWVIQGVVIDGGGGVVVHHHWWWWPLSQVVVVSSTLMVWVGKSTGFCNPVGLWVWVQCGFGCGLGFTNPCQTPTQPVPNPGPGTAFDSAKMPLYLT